MVAAVRVDGGDARVQIDRKVAGYRFTPTNPGNEGLNGLRPLVGPEFLRRAQVCS